MCMQGDIKKNICGSFTCESEMRNHQNKYNEVDLLISNCHKMCSENTIFA